MSTFTENPLSEEAENATLIHKIYASVASEPFTEAELLALLAKARATNQALGITGMLLYVDGSFFQVLEGDEAVVTDLYNKISLDKRHTQVTKLIMESIPKRSFSDWTMGYVNMSRENLESIDGLNDFFQKKTCLGDIDAGRARKLLEAFAKGRWRIA